MAERSFEREVQDLRLGAGDIFRGEGILAITKALLQSGVSYVAGYQGAPISHLMDVLADAKDVMSDLGVHFETSASEATAAATLSASVMYPVRGAVTFKSTAGANVAADALSNLASSGVTGGALDRHRRGLWRGLLDHAGAQPCLCDEVADLASRSAPRSADARSHGGGGLRTVGSVELAGHARSAHSHLSRARAIRRQGQQEARLRASPGLGKSVARRQPHRAPARVVHAGEGEDREALAGGGRIHQEPQAQRILRPQGRPGRRHCSRRPLQRRLARLAAIGPRRRLWRDLDPDLRPQCRLSDHRGRDGRILPRQVGGADG